MLLFLDQHWSICWKQWGLSQSEQPVNSLRALKLLGVVEVCVLLYFFSLSVQPMVFIWGSCFWASPLRCLNLPWRWSWGHFATPYRPCSSLGVAVWYICYYHWNSPNAQAFYVPWCPWLFWWCSSSWHHFSVQSSVRGALTFTSWNLLTCQGYLNQSLLKVTLTAFNCLCWVGTMCILRINLTSLWSIQHHI